MPIVELPKKRTNKDRGYTAQDDTGHLWAKECYNTDTWRRFRQSYLMSHPLCELHSALNEVVPAEEVHHIVPISQAGSRLEANDIAFDSNNLMSLCRECHNWYHAIQHGRHMTPDDKHKMEVYNQLVQTHGNKQ